MLIFQLLNMHVTLRIVKLPPNECQDKIINSNGKINIDSILQMVSEKLRW